MAASEAQISFDCTMEVEDAPNSGVYITFAELTNFTPPSPTVDQVEVTHQKSPGRAKEFKAGLADYGSATADFNYIPSSATDLAILAWRADGSTRSVRFTYPEGDTDTFPANVESYQTSLPLGDKLGSSLSMKCAGLPVRG